MADSFDLNASLAQVVADHRDNNFSFLQISKSSEEGQSPDRLQSMLKIFQEAFPDSDFSVIQEAEGRKGIRGIKKKAPLAANEITAPDGFSPKINAAGIKDFTAALERAVTDEDKLHIALQLNAAVQNQKAFNFVRYKQQAEAEQGVPDLVQAISRIQQAEASSPHNPGTGMPSAERLQLMQTLGQARLRAANRVAELGANDIELVPAENLAKSTVLELEKGLALIGKKQFIDERDARKLAREGAIASFDPGFIQNVSILRSANASPTDAQRRSIAETLFDKRVVLTETERLLATADTESLQGLFLTLKDPKHKEQALQLLAAKERAAVGNDDEAKLNIELFKRVYSTDVTNLAATKSPKISERARRTISENTARFSGKEREQANANARVGFQRELLTEVVSNLFQDDVSKWHGVAQSDDTAKAVIKEMRIRDPKSLTMKQFITNYLNYNDGKDLATKSQALQAITSSAISAFSPSVLLPLPSEESVKLQTQAMLASSHTFSLVNNIIPTFGIGVELGVSGARIASERVTDLVSKGSQLGRSIGSSLFPPIKGTK